MRVRSWWHDHQWPVIWVLFIVAIVLGYIGFEKHFTATGEKRSAWDLAYLSLQLFWVKSGSIAPPISWELNVARWLAPFVALYAAARALMALFREQIQAFRMQRLKNHTVICGLGRKGMQLIKDLRGSGQRMVIIERDEWNERIEECRDRGVMVLLGNATDPYLLRKAGAGRAGYLVAVCGDDGTNVEIAMNAQQLIRGRPAGASRTLRSSIHIVDLRLCEMLKRHRIFTKSTYPFEIRIFNNYENSARLLFQDHPLDWGGIAADSRSVHLVVLGFGQMGESVVLQTAKIGHFANFKKAHITIVDREATKKENLFFHRYPNFKRICETTFIEEDLEDPDFIKKISHWDDDKNFLTTAVVCLDADSRSLSCALNLVSKPGRCRFPILVRMAREAGLAALIQEKESDSGWAVCLEGFGMIDQTCRWDVLQNEKLDRLARANHQIYVKNQEREGQTPETDHAMLPWDELDEDYKDSNRQAADHIPIKLRAIGCGSTSSEIDENPLTEFEPEEVELLARMEHSRYVAERLLAGWTPGPKSDPRKKTNPYLVDWNELPEDVRNFDRKVVREIPDLLASVGEKIYRR